MKNIDIKNIDCCAALAMTKNVQSGRSMIEMLGVLAIIGVLSVGGIAGYSKAMTKYRINKTIEQITLIAGNVRTFFAPQGNYDGLMGASGNNRVLRKAKLVPDEMWDDTDKTFKNVFGYGIYINKEHKSSETDYKAFVIFYRLPNDEEVCIELATQNWTNLGKTIIRVDGLSCGGTCPGTSQYFLSPVDIDAAVSICSGGVFSVSFYIDVDPSSDYWQSKINPSS